VRAEISGALQRGIVIIPVLIERTPLPHADALPEDIRELVFHQKHVVTHEQFGRDVAGLVEAVQFARKTSRTRAGGWPARWIALATLLLIGGVWWIATLGPSERDRQSTLLMAEAERKRTEEAERQRLALLKAEEERKRAEPMRPGWEFRDCADVCPTMVVVPAGEFMMGSPLGEADRSSNEGPQRKVNIERPFAVGKFEVTFAEWEACVAAGGCTSNRMPSDQGWGKGRRPVINVSWHDAKEYVKWLSDKTGRHYRLLSEAEWEYAARAGTTTRYAFGGTISKSQAQFPEGGAGSAGETAEVGSFPANRFGLHDMHGNVLEWVEDNWHPDDQGAPLDGSVWRGGDVSLRVCRGGAWVDNPDFLRSARRVIGLPDDRLSNVGFRLARTLD
jgi:formylglycine-generating enzyme required for sulfatase activity